MTENFPPATVPTLVAPSQPSATERVREILERWRGGRTPITSAEVEALIRGYPTLIQSMSIASMLRLLLRERPCLKHDEVIRHATLSKVQEIERDMAGAEPSPMERLLAERVAVCWLDLYTCQVRAEQRSTTMTIPQDAYESKRVEAADRRFLRAIKALAEVRRLRLPDVALVDARSVTIHHRGSRVASDGIES